MNIEEFRAYCLSKKAATECLPFDEDTLVFKVLGKMFTLTGLDGDFRFSVKVVPEEGEVMRERHPCVRPAYHMNKTHWVSVDVDGSVDDNMLKNWINTSYDLVVRGMSKKQQMQIQSM